MVAPPEFGPMTFWLPPPMADRSELIPIALKVPPAMTAPSELMAMLLATPPPIMAKFPETELLYELPKIWAAPPPAIVDPRIPGATRLTGAPAIRFGAP